MRQICLFLWKNQTTDLPVGKKEDFYEMKLRTRGISGTRNQAESERECAHRVIARKAAAEGIVLLENNGVLPLKKEVTWHCTGAAPATPSKAARAPVP